MQAKYILKMKIDIKNHFGEIKKNTICNIKKVWINNELNDIYIQLDEKGFGLITSITNVELFKAGEVEYKKD